MSLLEIKALEATVDDTPILKGVNLSIPPGQVHAIMGPNGSGKSTLSNVIMGHPGYKITGGDILIDGESVLDIPPDERARKGLFLSFQYPASIPGVTLTNFLRNVLKNQRGQEVPFREFRKEVKGAMESLQINESFASRYVNEGFSGGEKKRNELLQMSLIKPKMAILDEIDSGLDIDALRVIADTIESMRDPARSMLIITHYQRVLSHISVDRVHVFMDGRIITSGDKDLSNRLEQEGYDSIAQEAGVTLTR